MSEHGCRDALLVLCAVSMAPGSGCAAAGDGVPPVARRDSAGIELVLNVAPEWTPERAWRVDSTQAMELVAPGIDLYRLAGITEVDGTIVVANAGTHQLLFFDTTGAFQFARGREGAGPREFRSIFLMRGCRGGRLAVYDGRGFRVAWWGSDGEPRGFWYPTRQGNGLTINPSALAADCSIVGHVRQRGFNEEISGVHRRSRILARTATDSGAAVDTLLQYPAAAFWEYFDQGSVIFDQQPWGPRPFVFVTASGILHGDGESYEYRALDFDGKARRIVRRVDHRSREVPADSLAAYKRRLVEAETGELRALQERAVESIPYRETMTPWDTAAMDVHENVWIRERRDGPLASWAVFDTSGRWLGTVELPHRWRIAHIGDRRMLASYLDADQVERVIVVPLMKP